MSVSTSSSSDSTNGRVTLAVLGTKLDHVIEKLSEVCELGKERDARIEQLEKQAITNNDRLRQLSRAVAWVGGIAASVIAAVIIAAVISRLGL